MLLVLWTSFIAKHLLIAVLCVILRSIMFYSYMIMGALELNLLINQPTSQSICQLMNQSILLLLQDIIGCSIGKALTSILALQVMMIHSDYHPVKLMNYFIAFQMCVTNVMWLFEQTLKPVCIARFHTHSSPDYEASLHSTLGINHLSFGL